MTVRSHAEPRNGVMAQTETEDQLLGMVAALAAQLAVTRERLDTVERLAQAAGLFGPDDVDAYVARGEAASARDTIRRTLVARIFRPVRDAAARTARTMKAESA